MAKIFPVLVYFLLDYRAIFWYKHISFGIFVGCGKDRGKEEMRVTNPLSFNKPHSGICAQSVR